MMLMAFMAALSSACSTFVTYSDQNLPDTDIAVLKCFLCYYFVYISECHVSAIDGQRPEVSQLLGLTSKLKLGRHWVEFGIEHYFGGGGGITDVCAFDFDFDAGYQYQIKAHTLETDIGWMARRNVNLYTGTISIEAVDPAGQTQTYQTKTTCKFGGGSLCRKTSDCVPHPAISCFPQEGYSFGICSFNK